MMYLQKYYPRLPYPARREIHERFARAAANMNRLVSPLPPELRVDPELSRFFLQVLRDSKRMLWHAREVRALRGFDPDRPMRMRKFRQELATLTAALAACEPKPGDRVGTEEFF